MSTRATITFHTISVDGVRVFYREAGTSGRARNFASARLSLVVAHVQSADPFVGGSLSPHRSRLSGIRQQRCTAPDEFSYTFDHLAEVVGALTDALDLKSYAVYMQDYGGPVGFRLCLAHRERVRALIIQNAVADEAGLGPIWEARRKFWADRKSHEAELRSSFFSFEASRQRHVGSSPNVDRYDPDAWQDETAFLSRPGEADIQSDLFYDYRNNVASYPKWQGWLREVQPPTLVVWGKYDPSFATKGAFTYQRDVPAAEVHILDAGHFALDEATDEIAALMRKFLQDRGLHRSAGPPG